MGEFELQWNDFQDSLSSSFKELRDDGDLFDITLACDDDQLEAHKTILSASSTFFKSVIKRNPHAHPLLYLKGVKMEDLRSMLDFMYVGKTKVAQEHVERFLALGEELGVKGLVRNLQKQSEEKEPVEKKENKELDSVEKLLAKTDGKAKGTKRIKKIKEMAIMDVKVEESLISQDGDFSFEIEEGLVQDVDNETNESEIATSQASDVSIDLDVDAQIESFLVKVGDSEGRTGWQCIDCNKYSKTKANLKKHVEIHIEGLSFSCKYCDKVCKTRNSLNLHVYTSKHCKTKRDSGQ